MRTPVIVLIAVSSAIALATVVTLAVVFSKDASSTTTSTTTLPVPVPTPGPYTVPVPTPTTYTVPTTVNTTNTSNLTLYQRSYYPSCGGSYYEVVGNCGCYVTKYTNCEERWWSLNCTCSGSCADCVCYDIIPFDTCHNKILLYMK